ncbi:MAG: CRISPR-associated helicase Cas3' [Caldisericum sp.]
MNFEVLSHPDRLLEEHVAQMQQLASILIRDFTYHFEKVQFNTQILNKIIELHDAGKSSKFFQYYLREKTHNPENCKVSECSHCLFLDKHSEIGKDLLEKPNLKNHSLIGALLALNEEPDIYDIISYFIIKNHHGSLPNFSHKSITEIGDDPSKLRELDKIIDALPESYHKKLKLIKEILKNKKRRISKPLQLLNNYDSPIEFYFLTLTLYSLLLSSDKGSLMYPSIEALSRQRELANLTIEKKWVDNYRSTLIAHHPASTLNELRSLAWQTAVENLKNNFTKHIFSLNLPTGLGKTLINLKIAQLLIEMNQLNNYKIIYCLPFTSIIDQTAAIIENALILSGIDTKLLLVDHHLAQQSFENNIETSYVNNGYQDSISEYILNSWETPIILTTFVKLWDSIFNNSGKQLIKFNNLSHSVIILDEIQNIPPQFHKALETALMEMTRIFDTRFIVSTATHPVLFAENAIKLHSFQNDENYFFSKLNRIKLERFTKNSEDKISLEELAEILILKQKEGFSQLVILNTIRQSVELYTYITKHYHSTSLKILHLSSQHIPLLRRWKIRQTKNLLNQNKHKKGPTPLLISTQVVEAGVDLDFDIVWREFAPIDSINQAAGRCNRNGLSNTKGQVFLFNLKDSSPSNVYHSIMLSKSVAVLENYFGKASAIEEDSFSEINSEYFHEIRKAIADNSVKSDEMIGLMCQLKFENISANQFRLIEEQPKYNIFLPVNKHAKALWQQYQELISTQPSFDTRRKIKKLIPQLLNYTVAVYKTQYIPQPNQMDQFLLFEESVGSYYSMDTGFSNSEKVVVL